MRFEIAKREITVERDHISLVILVIIVAGLGQAGILYGIMQMAFPSGDQTDSAAIGLAKNLTELSWILSTPILAAMLLYATRYFNLKKDAETSRSLAAARVILGAALFLIGSAMLALTGLGSSSTVLTPATILTTIIGMIGIFLDGVLVYLWMLFLLERDMKRLAEAAPYAALYGLALIAISNGFIFFLMQSSGDMFSFKADLGTLVTFLSDMLFAVIILYRIQGKDLDDFSKIYAGATLVIPVSYIVMAALGSVSWSTAAGKAVITISSLGLLYLLSRAKTSEGTL